jgi:hypothetical protein
MVISLGVLVLVHRFAVYSIPTKGFVSYRRRQLLFDVLSVANQ